MKRLLALALFVAACGKGDAEKPAVSGTTATPAKTLRFSAIPDQNTTELKEKFDRIAAHLGKTLGVPVEYVASADYQACVDAFKNGQIQLAWFGGLTGVQARALVPGSRAIAQGDTDDAFVSYFIAHKDTGLELSDKFPAAIADLKFTFGSQSSTSGRLMPEFFIKQSSGKLAAEFFKTPPGFSGGHDKTAELVASGAYQAGVLNYSVYDKRVKEGKTDPNVVRIIWKTPSYADYNFSVHPDVEKSYGAGFTAKLTDALCGMDEELCKAFPRKRLKPATNDLYEGIRRVAIELGMVRE